MRTLAFRIHFHMHIIVISFSLFFFFTRPPLSFAKSFTRKTIFLNSAILTFARNPAILTTFASSWVLIFICFILLAFVQLSDKWMKTHTKSREFQTICSWNELVYFCIKLENARLKNKPLSTWRISIIWLQSKTITEN